MTFTYSEDRCPTCRRVLDCCGNCACEGETR
jgi:hypothetical protein